MVMVDSGDSLTTEMLVKRILARSSFILSTGQSLFVQRYLSFLDAMPSLVI